VPSSMPTSTPKDQSSPLQQDETQQAGSATQEEPPQPKQQGQQQQQQEQQQQGHEEGASGTADANDLELLMAQMAGVLCSMAQPTQRCIVGV